MLKMKISYFFELCVIHWSFLHFWICMSTAQVRFIKALNNSKIKLYLICDRPKWMKWIVKTAVHSVKFYRFHWNSGLKLYAIGKNNSELSEETNIKEAQRGLEPISIDAYVIVAARFVNWATTHSYILLKQIHYLKRIWFCCIFA